MYYQNYEDYMRSILGYPIQEQNLNINTYADYSNINNEYSTQLPRYSNEILELYPEIYKIINPMVCKVCDANTKPITKELVEKMTEEIYLNIESNPSEYVSEVVNVRINLPDQRINSDVRKQNKSNVAVLKNVKEKVEEQNNKRVEITNNNTNEIKENRQKQNNSILRDLIKILILNRLLGGIRPQIPRRPNYYFRPTFQRNPRINMFEN